jgi:hypothetical protein
VLQLLSNTETCEEVNMGLFSHTGDIVNLLDTHLDCGIYNYCCLGTPKYKAARRVGMRLDDGTCGRGLQGQGGCRGQGRRSI